jgi:hypothetical protein
VQKKLCFIRGLLAADLAVMLTQQLVAATRPLGRLLAECARRAQALREWYRTTAADTPGARATTLLREWLSPQQRAQFDAEAYFDVVGCDSGKRYRIHYGTSMNVHEINDAGHSKVGWCFVPNRRLVAGDVMLAQKIALETSENKALAVANRFSPNQVTFRASRRRPY